MAIAGELERAEQSQEALALLRFIVHHLTNAEEFTGFSVPEEAQAPLEKIQDCGSSRGAGAVPAWTQKAVVEDVISWAEVVPERLFRLSWYEAPKWRIPNSRPEQVDGRVKWDGRPAH